MRTALTKPLGMAALGLGVCLLMLATATSSSPQLAESRYPLLVTQQQPVSDAVPSFRITPSEMTLTGDVAVCGPEITDPEVSTWCKDTPPGTIMLGVDPASPDWVNWDGGQATTSVDIADIVSPTIAVLSIAWPDRDGKGIHSPHEGQLTMVEWNSVPIWSKRTSDVSDFDHYYAAQHQTIIATAVVTAPGNHTLSLRVPEHTAWDISSIRIALYPMWQSLHGVAYSPFRDCQNPHWGPFPSEAEITEDIERIAHSANGIRTYSALATVGEIPRVATAHGLPVCAGAWLERETDSEGNPIENRNREEIDALIDIANTVPLDCAIVGNEILLFNALSEDELLAYIQEVQDAVDVPVTTADVGATLRQHPRVLETVDLIMVHTYPYWWGRSIDEGVDFVVQDYLAWRRDYPNKRVIIGETGWPSDGPARVSAVPSLANQQRFFYGFLAAAERHNIDYYYMTGHDELWKREGGVGSHWGYGYSDRTGKHVVQSLLLPSRLLSPHSNYLPLVLKGVSASSIVYGTEVTSSLVDRPQQPAPEILSDGQFVVFDEYYSGANHFVPSGWMGDVDDIGLYECASEAAYQGDMSIRVTYDPTGDQGWAGIYWQEPADNWATVEDAGYDLDDAVTLQFYARGENGGEQLEALVGGLWGPYPDSLQPALSTDVITLTQEWSPYSIDLRGRDLSGVIGGFGLLTNQCMNTEPVTMYLDSISYVRGGDPGTPAPTPTPDAPYTIDVYRDKDAAGNHYVPSGMQGDIGDIHIDECWRSDTHTGSSAIQVQYTAEGLGPYRCDGSPPCDWAGVYWQYPVNNWGDRPGGYSLTGARGITFWARGEKGDEWISLGAGGILCDDSQFSDTLCPIQLLDPAPLGLTTAWQPYTISLDSGLNLSRVVGGFLWTASRQDNPLGATFYLDDIAYLFNTEVPTLPHWVCYGSRLTEGYDMGVDSSEGRTDWVGDMGGYFRMAYPAGQDWGAAFITVGPPTSSSRPCKDLSAYQNVSVDLRGTEGNEPVFLGLKDCTDPDNGSETLIEVEGLTAAWRTYTYPISVFTTADPSRLYVVTEFVFLADSARTVDFRNIRYLP